MSASPSANSQPNSFLPLPGIILREPRQLPLAGFTALLQSIAGQLNAGILRRKVASRGPMSPSVCPMLSTNSRSPVLPATEMAPPAMPPSRAQVSPAAAVSASLFHHRAHQTNHRVPDRRPVPQPPSGYAIFPDLQPARCYYAPPEAPHGRHRRRSSAYGHNNMPYHAPGHKRHTSFAAPGHKFRKRSERI